MDTGTDEPWVRDFTENSPWRWEFWRVGLNPEDLFTTLDAKYNRVPYRIQGDEAFHHDVSDAAHEAENLDDFHARLALRRDQRLQELNTAWDSVAVKIVCSPSGVFGGVLTRWVAFQQFTANRSLDSMVHFFHSLLPPPTPETPRLQDPFAPGSPTVEPNHPTPSLPDTAPVSPGSNPPDAAPTPLPPRPRRTTRRFPPPPSPLTKSAGVSKRSPRGRPSRPPAAPRDAKQRPSRKPKAPVATQTRSSRRLAGHAPEFGGA